jgi:hypothetical protein
MNNPIDTILENLCTEINVFLPLNFDLWNTLRSELMRDDIDNAFNDIDTAFNNDLHNVLQ